MRMGVVLMQRVNVVRVVCSVIGVGLACSVHASDLPDIKLSIKNHQFTPAEIVVPAKQKVRFVIENQDDSAEEFESYELNREKVVPAKSVVNIYIGPLEPGRYPFVGEFHQDTAKGVVVVK